jgi:hypothetical protein
VEGCLEPPLHRKVEENGVSKFSVIKKENMKFCVFHAMKAYTENGGIAPLIRKLDIRWGEW